MQPAARPTSPQAVDAAIAAAHRTAFSQLLPAQRAADRRRLPGGAWRRCRTTPCARSNSPSANGPRSACWPSASTDMPRTADTYRPHTTPGVYVPTVIPAVTQWPQRKPWLLTSADQFRPGPPPALTANAGRATSTRSRRWAGATASSAAPSRPRSAASGTTRCRPCTTASCVRWPCSPVATCWPMRACSPPWRRRWTMR